MYQPRFYRKEMGSDRFKAFTVLYKETDLWIGVNGNCNIGRVKEFVLNKIIELRNQLENYLRLDPGFFKSLSPYRVQEYAPEIAKIMADAAARAGVGPMAAVAGAFSREIGKSVEEEFGIEEIIIENGGDLYLKSKETLFISVYAGNSPVSGRICIEIPPVLSPLGICTSSGTVGHSLSFGKADAVTVLCKDAPTADAYATALGNLIKGPEDIQKALDKASMIKEVLGIVVIVGDKIGARGNFKLVPVI